MIKPENWAIVTRGPTRSNVQQQLHLWSDLHQDEEDDHDAIYVGKVAITTIGQSNKSFQTVAKVRQSRDRPHSPCKRAPYHTWSLAKPAAAHCVKQLLVYFFFWGGGGGEEICICCIILYFLYCFVVVVDAHGYLGDACRAGGAL